MTDINERDLFVALVGHVSAGKSSIFKRLLGLPASDDSVPVRERGGSTTSVLWDVLPRPRSARGCSVAEEDQGPCRILADMPGMGQAEEPGYYYSLALLLVPTRSSSRSGSSFSVRASTQSFCGCRCEPSRCAGCS